MRSTIVMAILVACLFVSNSASAQTFHSTATPEIGHDLSPSLQSMANNVKTDQLCIQQPAQLLPNSTGLTLDQNFCGFTPTPFNTFASDDSGAAGPNHYFQTENFSAVIFDKTGKVVLGPFPTATFWNGFTSPNNTCSFTWSDVVVLYDRDAQRWFVSRFAGQQVDANTVSWYQCFAVSMTPDPAGQYNRYVFFIGQSAIDNTLNPPQAPPFNDYPKFGIWPDAYYMTADEDKIFPGKGVVVAAFERNKMLNGQPAQSIVFTISNGGFRAGMLPADRDGKTPPPAGSPNYLVRTLDPNLGWPISALQVWTFQADWTNGAGVLALQDLVTPDPFNSVLCPQQNGSPGQNCIPQPNTTQGLDPLAGGRPMFRLAYRNFGDHEAMTFNQTVDTGDFPNHAGVRWYELRKSGANPWAIYQQNTFAPDADNRWIGSVAMDRFGNMAMGYNVSSSATFPEIRIAGRLANDPLGQMSEAAILEPGFGSQLQTVFFADYSQTTLDPLDDCTFWHTGTYQPANSFNTQYFWGTKVGSFRFPNCVADLSVSKTRSPSGAISAGTNVTYTVTATNNGPADAGNVTLTDSVPAGTSFVSLLVPLGWNCTTPKLGSSGSIICKKSIVANGESAQFVVVATINCNVPDGTVINNTANVSASTPPDNNTANNSQGVSFTVKNPAPIVSTSVALSMLPQNNHDLVNVGLAATATDGACPAPTNFAVQVFGNEDDETPTDSMGTVFSPDAKNIAVATLELRQERVDSGNGRVYLVVVSATDTAGGTGFATVTVVVPLSSSAANIATVNALAAAAKAFADSNHGAPPPAYFVIGDGPVIGPKQ